MEVPVEVPLEGEVAGEVEVEVDEVGLYTLNSVDP
jgi:hypothetical protein